MVRKIRIISISIAIIIITLLFAVGTYFYGQSVKRGSEVELHKEDETVNVSTNVMSEKLIAEAKEWYGEQLPLDLTMTSYDDLTLKAHFIKNELDEKKAVILVHGFRKTKEDMTDYAKFYADEGYDILMPDARGHGDSEGKYYGYGWHDRLDIIDWINKLVDEYGIEHIVLHGNSAGAATVLMVSGEDLRDEVIGIIADSSYTTMKEELKHQLKHIYGLPGFPLLDVTSLITKVRAGYFFGDVSVVKQVEKNELPLFIVHGDADDLVPTWMGEELYDKASGEKQLWIVPDVGHIKAYELETEQFQQKLKQFLNDLQDE